MSTWGLKALAVVAGLASKSDEELNQPKYARAVALAKEFIEYELGLAAALRKSAAICDSPSPEITN